MTENNKEDHIEEVKKKMISNKLWFFYAFYPQLFTTGLAWYLFFSNAITDLEFVLLLIMGCLSSMLINASIANHNNRMLIKSCLELEHRRIKEQVDMIENMIEKRRKEQKEKEKVVLK